MKIFPLDGLVFSKVGRISQKTVSVVSLRHFCPSLTFRFVFFPTAAPSVVCTPTSILHPVDPCTEDYCCQSKPVTYTRVINCSDSSMLKNVTVVPCTKYYCCYKEVGTAHKYQNKSVTKTTAMKCSDSSMLKNATNVTLSCEAQCSGKCEGEK